FQLYSRPVCVTFFPRTPACNFREFPIQNWPIDRPGGRAKNIKKLGDTMLDYALDGVRVVDLSRILAGPWCTQNLADLGAAVLKIERPQTGDDTRRWGPPFVTGKNGEQVAAYFLACNRGKQSVTLDFTRLADREWLLRQIQDADVLVENYKVGTLARYGLDYETLAKINPRLIYLSVTGFGQNGPYAHKPGYDYIFQGMGGLMSYTGLADGDAGAGPLRTGVAVVDLMTG